MQVREVMTTPVVSVTPETTVKELLTLWTEHPVSGFPVVDGEKVVGVVSETDLVYRDRPLKPPAFVAILDAFIPITSPHTIEQELRKTVGTKVSDVMTSPALTVGADDDLSVAASLMTDRHVNRLPVVDDAGRLVGIVSRADLVRALV
jgi:CBS domain-containing protein